MPADRQGPDDPAARRALDLIRAGERFLLTGHERPDGDCIGAQAALARVLSALGKRAFVLNPDPVEPQFDYLARELDFGVHEAGRELPEHDVAVLLDGSELSRCGPLEGPLAAHPSKKLVIDHHVHHGDAWWDEAWVDTTASATGLLVRRIARALDVELDRVAALGVFTSLVTDTGWFKYSNTDAETLTVAAEVCAAGVEPHVVFGSIYQRSRPEQPQAIARVLDSLEYVADGRGAVCSIARAEEQGLADSDEVLDILRAVEAVEVVLFLRELEDGRCKLSARAKSDYPVNELAARFGGGGHRKAAGATLPGPLSEAKRRVVDALLDDWRVASR